MWTFYFELNTGFIDSYSFVSLLDSIDCRESCLKDNSVKKVSNIFYQDYEEEK